MPASDHAGDDVEHLTEIKVAGANCPWCLNDALDRLRSLEGVTAARSWMTSECIQVTHHGVDMPVLLDTLRATLHGVDSASHESLMVPVDPHQVEVNCRHGVDPSARRPSTG